MKLPEQRKPVNNLGGSRRKQPRGHLCTGAGLVEYILISKLVFLISLGLVYLFGDNVRAVFATAGNSVAATDSTPATRTANSDDSVLNTKQSALSGQVPSVGPTGRDLAEAKSRLSTAIAKNLKDTAHTRQWDFQSAKADPRAHPLGGQAWAGYRATPAGQRASDFWADSYFDATKWTRRGYVIVDRQLSSGFSRTQYQVVDPDQFKWFWCSEEETVRNLPPGLVVGTTRNTSDGTDWKIVNLKQVDSFWTESRSLANSPPAGFTRGKIRRSLDSPTRWQIVRDDSEHRPAEFWVENWDDAVELTRFGYVVVDRQGSSAFIGETHYKIIDPEQFVSFWCSEESQVRNLPEGFVVGITKTPYSYTQNGFRKKWEIVNLEQAESFWTESRSLADNPPAGFNLDAFRRGGSDTQDRWRLVKTHRT